jgi:membrane-bound lytic murein transglycosylase B
MAMAGADYAYREAVRGEQESIYQVAAQPGLEPEVLKGLPPERAAVVADTAAGLRALWRAAGISDPSLVRVRRNRRAEDSAPVDVLRGLYRDAGDRYGVDWTYLASINFVESDFGRVNGPSSAGALGPMQFMPATWRDYGGGGDIMSPRDSIQAAARYLARMGAPGDMDRAIYRYNNDADYVEAVKGLASALRSDPAFLDRLYYWSTAG